MAGAVAFQYWNGGYDVDLGMTGDEAAHFVNSLVVRDYLMQDFGRNPVDFAKNYYEHLPRVSIGHWPPFFYIVQALLVALFDRSVQAAIFFQAVVLAALSACVGSVMVRRYGAIAGAAAALSMLLSPVPVYLVNAVMVDNFMALMVLLSTLAWAHYAKTQRLSWAIVFGLGASATILTKGSGFALALLPLFHAALSGRWRLLIRGRTWIAGAIVAALTLPWTILTMRFVADGFNFQPGIAYSTLAAERYGAALGPTVGYVVLAAFLVGAIAIVRANRRETIDHIDTALLSTAFAVLIFQIVAPADIAPRYLIPLLPPVLLMAARGVAAVCVLSRLSGKWLATVSICAVFALNAVETFRTPHVGSHLMDRVAERIMAFPDANPLVLVAGAPNVEGALIAEFASLDPERHKYIVRGTKLLASGDFMGADYRPRFASDDAVAEAIGRNHFGWVVIDLGPESMSWSHVVQVIHAADRQLNWQQVGLFRRDGRVAMLYRILGPSPSPQDIENIMSIVALDKKLDGN